MEEITIKADGYSNLKIKRGKSIIKIGDSKLGGTDITIEVSTKFNWLQKKLWK